MGTDVPESVKINSVNVYGGDKYGMQFLKEQTEKILDINIDYYFKINLEGLRNIVDSIGGIYFDVPEHGMKYSDPLQDLYIDIKGGYQLLDGSAAEGLLRFRKDYTRQDLQRVEVSREFIKEFVSQVFKRDTVKNNLNSLTSDCIKYVETDFSINDAPKYIECLKNIKYFNDETLPGSGQIIDGTYYYVYDASETKKIAEKFFDF